MGLDERFGDNEGDGPGHEVAAAAVEVGAGQAAPSTQSAMNTPLLSAAAETVQIETLNSGTEAVEAAVGEKGQRSPVTIALPRLYSLKKRISGGRSLSLRSSAVGGAGFDACTLDTSDAVSGIELGLQDTDATDDGHETGDDEHTPLASVQLHSTVSRQGSHERQRSHMQLGAAASTAAASASAVAAPKGQPSGERPTAFATTIVVPMGMEAGSAGSAWDSVESRTAASKGGAAPTTSAEVITSRHPRGPWAHRLDSASDALLQPIRRMHRCMAPVYSHPCWKVLVALVCTAVCVVGYGLSLYINGVSGRELQLPQATSLVLMSGSRAMCLSIILVAMWASGHAPKEGILLNRHAVLPIVMCFASNSAFYTYAALVEGGQVSVLSAMISLYSIVPTSFGLLFKGEDRGWKKMVGIALSLTAVLMLALGGQGFSDASSNSSSSSSTSSAVALKVVLFLTTVGLWGGSDTVSAYIGRSLDTYTVTFANLIGQLMTASVYGFVAAVSGEPQSTDSSGPTASSHAMALLAIVGANSLAIVGWICFVLLGKTGQASTFVPVISLYVYIPVMLGVFLLGEDLSSVKIAGIVLAAVACLLIAVSANATRQPASKQKLEEESKHFPESVV